MSELQEKVKDYLGSKNIQKKELPEYLSVSLNPQKPLRPYQEECLRYLLSYLEDYDERSRRPHLLFHMATGSGKTLIMAATILYFYAQGYRNFLFFVGSTNILEKTKENFLNKSSSKYLFAPQIVIEGKRVEIRHVDNFQGNSGNDINLCLETIQGLHSKLNSNRENALTYDDFSDQPVVLISDEAHHMNSATRKGAQTAMYTNLFNDDVTQEYADEDTKNWETTAMRIFQSDNGRLPNVMLEFTATADLTDLNIATKYEDKVIYDYPLRRFREDGYSKEVEVVQSDSSPIDRALQAIVVSQFKCKLFAKIRQNVKPVVMFKSKTIKENGDFISAFVNSVSNLKTTQLDALSSKAKGVVKIAFDYFESEGITFDNLILELQEDFSKERLLLIDGNNITPEKQLLLNSLEERSNQVRAVFAVDMLNEGWDVLNLFDIVRLYETRDARNGRPGKTTMQEAQLIGRGARYMPFIDPAHSNVATAMRKYDSDTENPLRAIETLHYHSQNNTRYIQELHTALVETGIWASLHVEKDFYIKKNFQNTSLYNYGLVFANERIPLAEAENDGTIGKDIINSVFKVTMPTGKMKTGLLFGDNADNDVLTTITAENHLSDLGDNVVRTALNCFVTFHFCNLKKLYPQLLSISDFIRNKEFLKNIRIKVIGSKDNVSLYSQPDKFFIATEILRQIEPLIAHRAKSYKGTKEFKPTEIKKAFNIRRKLRFSIKNANSQEEFGRSMKESFRQDLQLDLSQVEWYAHNDCYGTSEEKALVKYIESIQNRLTDKYEEFYLLRNEKEIRIYDFQSGQPFEPDFILFLKCKKTAKMDNIQIFIEPKGNHLRLEDKWKEDFLKELKDNAKINYFTSTSNFCIWGLPFFTENQNEAFLEGFKQDVFS